MKRVDYAAGQKINGVTFIKELPPHSSPTRNTRKALFKCHCGKEFEAIIRSVVTKNTTSCGCWGAKSRSIRFTTHGLRKHELYSTWCSIKTRCYNKKRADYKYYGSKGVILSDEFHDFKVFLDYIGSLPNYERRKELNLTLDRIKGNKNYERGNLKWSTKLEQANNTIKTCLKC
jgi:hypothetical protein